MRQKNLRRLWYVTITLLSQVYLFIALCVILYIMVLPMQWQSASPSAITSLIKLAGKLFLYFLFLPSHILLCFSPKGLRILLFLCKKLNIEIKQNFVERYMISLTILFIFAGIGWVILFILLPSDVDFSKIWLFLFLSPLLGGLVSFCIGMYEWKSSTLPSTQEQIYFDNYLEVYGSLSTHDGKTQRGDLPTALTPQEKRKKVREGYREILFIHVVYLFLVCCGTLLVLFYLDFSLSMNAPSVSLNIFLLFVILFIFHIYFSAGAGIAPFIIEKVYISRKKRISKRLFERYVLICGISGVICLGANLLLMLIWSPLIIYHLVTGIVAGGIGFFIGWKAMYKKGGIERWSEVYE